MMWNYFFRPLLFFFFRDAEKSHELALSGIRGVGRLRWLSERLKHLTRVDDAALSSSLFGLRFPNPVGLAAGFDKFGQAVNGLEIFGFGFVELGTFTRHPQPGNPKPRLFRLSKDRALINRMGFNNAGADEAAQRLSNTAKLSIPVGISIGKSKITELERATEDYLYSLRKLYSYGDYFAINVSSPNTPGLRQLQEKKFLDELVSVLQKEIKTLARDTAPKPLLVKIAPDLTNEAIEDVLEICVTHGISGIIATNTTIARDGLTSKINEVGGLSGRPLTVRSREVVQFIRSRLPTMPIIGVGGIFTASDAYEMFKAGANLIQVYTGFVYEGPYALKKINSGLLEYMHRDEIQDIFEILP